jgi:ribosomal protein S20
MPITSSAKKALRSSRRKRVFNFKRKEKVVEVTKKIKKLVEERKVGDAEKLIPQAYKALDKAVKGKTIKANTAARKKSRLMNLLRAKK